MQIIKIKIGNSKAINEWINKVIGGIWFISPVQWFIYWLFNHSKDLHAILEPILFEITCVLLLLLDFFENNCWHLLVSANLSRDFEGLMSIHFINKTLSVWIWVRTECTLNGNMWPRWVCVCVCLHVYIVVYILTHPLQYGQFPCYTSHLNCPLSFHSTRVVLRAHLTSPYGKLVLHLSGIDYICWGLNDISRILRTGVLISFIGLKHVLRFKNDFRLWATIW